MLQKVLKHDSNDAPTKTTSNKIEEAEPEGFNVPIMAREIEPVVLEPIASNKALTLFDFEEKYEYSNKNPDLSEIKEEKEIEPYSNLPLDGVAVPKHCKKKGYIYPSVDDEGKAIFMIKPTPKITSKDLHWQDIDISRPRYSPEKWTFRHEIIIKYRYKGTKYKNSVSTTYKHITVEPEDLVRIELELEELLSKDIDLNILKKLAYIPFVDFYSSLNDITENINNPNIELDAVRLYALICRSYSNEMMKGYAFEKHGLILDKETLEKLDIEFGKNYFKVPNDEFIPKEYQSFANRVESYYSEMGYKLNGHNVSVYKDFIRKWGWGIGADKSGDSLIMASHVMSTEKPEPEEIESKGIVIVHEDEVLPPNSYNDYRKTSPLFAGAYNVFNDATDVNIQFAHDVKTLELKAIGDELGELSAKSNSLFNQLPWRKRKIQTTLDSLRRAFEFKKAEVKANVLIPVDIQTPFYNWSVEKQKEELGNYTTTIFWYYPNEEFLSALPTDVRNQLEEEIELLEAIRTGEISPKIACDTLGGESLLGLCDFNYTESLTNLKVYPNPIKNNNATVSFDINETQYVKMTLLDNNGAFVKDVMAWHSFNDGPNQYQINCSGLSSGSYMLVIITDKGESFTKKLLISK